MKKIISGILIISLLIAPMTVIAQTANCSVNTNSGIGPCGTGGSTTSSTGVSSATTATSCDALTGAALTQCQKQAAQGSLRQYNPSLNLSAGNTYNGTSITGVGGAIASCANVGSFLVNGASQLLASAGVTKAVNSAFKFVGLGGSSAVSTSDKAAQAQLKKQNNTTDCLNGVAYALAKSALAQITTKTLNWVNKGLNGNPLYVQNTNSYIGSLATQATFSYLNTVQASDPIFGNALQSSITFRVTGNSGALGKLNTPLNSPQAQAYNSFQTDFTNGGWNALMNPANNPVGAMFNAADTINKTISAQQLQASNEIQRNNGFLDLKRCVKYANNGQVAVGATNNGASVTLSQPTCLQYVTDTPGSVIANSVNFITSSPTRQLEYANQINEVLGSFFDSFVNNLLDKGLRGSGNGGAIDTNSFASEGSNQVDDTTGSADTSVLGYQSSSVDDGSTGDFDISRPQQLYDIIQTQYDFLNRTEDAQIALDRVIPAVGALDYCIPGPNPDWQTGTDSNWQAFTGAIQQADPKDASTAEKILGYIPVVGGLLAGIAGLFSGTGTAPALWTAQGVLSDKVTGQDIQINRTFYAPDGHADGVTTSQLEDGLNNAYATLSDQYHFYDTTSSTQPFGVVGSAFETAATVHPNTSLDVDGFLSDAYTNTDDIASYNQAASTIDQTYNDNISVTQSNIEQLEAIRQKVDAIVATAKARYEAQNPGINTQCLNQAYKINTAPIEGVARQEPDTTSSSAALHAEEDIMIQHAANSGAYFYNNEIK